MKLQIVLNTQKSPYLNQPTQKGTCQIFLPPPPKKKKKNPGIENFKPFNYPCHLKSGVPVQESQSTCLVEFSSSFFAASTT